MLLVYEVLRTPEEGVEGGSGSVASGGWRPQKLRF